MKNKDLEIKNTIVKYARIMDEKGMVNTSEGNISIFDRETGNLYITPHDTRKAFLEEDMVAVLKDGEQIGGRVRRSGEYLLHEAALKARPECNAVAHVHTPYLTAYAFCGQDIEIKCSTTFSLLFGKIPCLPYGEPGTPQIAAGIAEAMQDADLILLENHGVVSVGKTLEDAVKLIETAEEILRTYTLAKNIGPVSEIPEDKLESLCANHPVSRKYRGKQS